MTKYKYIVTDVETDGSVPGLFSMISIGAVQLDNINNTFYGELAPISTSYNPEALSVCSFTREQTESFDSAASTMLKFLNWLQALRADRLTFVSDNAGFDWQFVNYYFHLYFQFNPFGYSPMSITWLYKGLVKDTQKSFTHLRRTKHTHNALDDAIGNTEALLAMNEQYKLGLTK